VSFRRRYTVPLPGGRFLALGERILIMGVINVTPDSFSDGGLSFDPTHAIDAGVRMIDEGADLLDIGGESTRPGAAPVPVDEELRRVTPVIEGLARRVTVPISIDTYKARVADETLAAGASIVNDISGLRFEPALADVVARRGAAVILMHTRGKPAQMAQHASYLDVVDEVRDELRESIAFATGAGVAREAILVDPGIGFAKEAPHSYEVVARLEEFGELDRPLVVGPSRKSFLTKAVGHAVSPAERDYATAAAVAAVALAGAHIVRVHAVAPMRQVVRVADEIRRYHRAD
jgi:dihydropteroate synthase